MSSTLDHHGLTGERQGVTVATLRLPPLENALIPACVELAIAEAYFAAMRQPGKAQAPRLLLAISPIGIAGQRRLACVVSEVLPDDLELDLIELSDDELSRSLRESCTPFYSR